LTQNPTRAYDKADYQAVVAYTPREGHEYEDFQSALEEMRPIEERLFSETKWEITERRTANGKSFFYESFEPAVTETTNWLGLCEFSQSFTQGENQEQFHPVLVYMDHSGAFKIRGIHSLGDGEFRLQFDSSTEITVYRYAPKPVHYVEHDFNGDWCGYEKPQMITQLTFVSCHDNIMLALYDPEEDLAELKFSTAECNYYKYWQRCTGALETWG
jgi:hypothetical protein